MDDQDKLKLYKVLSDLKNLVDQGKVTKDQISTFFNTPLKDSPSSLTEEKLDLKKILYYIGGFIVLLGIIFLVKQFWNDLDRFSRSFIALGSAILTYALGYYFLYNKSSKDLGQAFFIISIILFPSGISTSLDAIGINISTSSGISIISVLLYFIYFISYYSLKVDSFLPFAVVSASVFFFSFTDYLFMDNSAISHFAEYRFLVLGVSYLAFGYYFSQTNRKFMVDIIYFFGLLMFLGFSLTLQGYSPHQNFFWELIYPFLLLSSFYGSIKLQNKSFLIAGTLFTFIFIGKLTAEYFSQSVGWPVALIIAGLAIMGTGYTSFELNKKLKLTYQ